MNRDFQDPFIYPFRGMTLSLHLMILQQLLKHLFSLGAFSVGFYVLLNITREMGEYEIKISTSMSIARVVFWCQLNPDSNTDSAPCLLRILRKFT